MGRFAPSVSFYMRHSGARADEQELRRLNAMWPFRSSMQPRAASRDAVETRVVDDRVFVLGLDHLYREATKEHERGELRALAERLVSRLGVQPADVPVEGYYGQDAALAAYFRAMRALQDQPESRRVELAGSGERLFAISTARIYGGAVPNGHLLYGGRDALTRALAATQPSFTVDVLVDESARLAREHDDISLVGVAARARDPALFAAVRESVVPYAEPLITGWPATPEYAWRVSPAVENAATRFHRRVPRALSALRGSTGLARAGRRGAILGRPQAERRRRPLREAAQTDFVPIQYYHWALRPQGDGLAVDAFWSDQRYRRAKTTEHCVAHIFLY